MWEVSQYTLTDLYWCAGGESPNRLYSPIRSVTPNLAGKVGNRGENGSISEDSSTRD
jgi:hypothetical protein